MEDSSMEESWGLGGEVKAPQERPATMAVTVTALLCVLLLASTAFADGSALGLELRARGPRRNETHMRVRMGVRKVGEAGGGKFREGGPEREGPDLCSAPLSGPPSGPFPVPRGSGWGTGNHFRTPRGCGLGSGKLARQVVESVGRGVQRGSGPDLPRPDHLRTPRGARWGPETISGPRVGADGGPESRQGRWWKPSGRGSGQDLCAGPWKPFPDPSGCRWGVRTGFQWVQRRGPEATPRNTSQDVLRRQR